MQMKGISRCGQCAYYEKGCKVAKDPGDPQHSFYKDCPLPDVVLAGERAVIYARWERTKKKDSRGRNNQFFCTNCGKEVSTIFGEYPTAKYCSECGAKMGGK